ncbi:AP-4 complex accessory subunit RUSC1 [Leptodactylus fuscus]|uniref:AP-4 complex accessory subunit RUSC1 n=1 Tax=Leptodactylus fuscus TaxID=238119 RepID=UPI003F4E8D88
MLTSRKALLSNLNYVHLQHVSLGVHLSMHSEMIEDPNNQSMRVKDGCHHTWKDTTMVDPNSNDPSMPCQCCDQHLGGQEASLQYSSLEDLDTIIRNECLSPDDLPLSPLSLSSPSTDSSSSSDFTLDDSPASMYYKEYSHDGLDTPDQQPDIIPLDAATESPFSPGPLYHSLQETDTVLKDNSTKNISPEITNNNMEEEDTPFIDWSSDSMLDSNSNTLIERLESSSMDSDTTIEPEVQTNKTGQLDSTRVEEPDLLPGLPFRENTSTPKKTITSFHELALRRRRSGGQLPSQPKRDRSDWLIVFSPDTEQPPINELTASVFYHGVLEPQTHPLPGGKEVTTFRELRYRNTLNKQQKVHEERLCMTTTEATSDPSCTGQDQHTVWEPDNLQRPLTPKTDLVEETIGEQNTQRQALKRRSGPATADIDVPSGGQHTQFSTTKRDKSARHEENPEKMVPPSTTWTWTRGAADGGDQRGQEVAECEVLMAEEAEESAQQQKKRLLIAVGSSVEKIISHFNTSRNQVQKAQLGDSRLSPVLGYLILNHLCPSMYSLLGDGLKAYQKDVIIGRRRLSPWSLVEASVKTGPETVHLLFSKVNRLPQLRDPQRKFNAFIFGLLNMKQLDVWALHLHQIYNQLSIFYLPSGFLPLAATLHVELRDELLLSLQPLSALTFHTDLLFEHHHLSLQDLPTPHKVHSPGHVADNWAVPSLQNILDLGGWITHNLTWNTENRAPSNTGKSLDSPGDKGSPKGSHMGTSNMAGGTSEPLTDYTTETSPDPTTSRDLTNNWWSHFSQASRMYIPANRESLTFTTLRKLTNWGSVDKELNQRASPTKERDYTEQRLQQEITGGGKPHRAASENEQQKPQENMEENLGLPNTATTYTQGTSHASARSAGAEWVKVTTTMDGGKGHHPNNEEKGNWLGQLFGASSSHTREMETKSPKSRRPSSWLPPNVSVWNLIRKQSTATKPDICTYEEEESREGDNNRHQRSLRALCDHAASGEAQLSFKKGDVLQLLGTVDEDWIQCRRGKDTGLVPVGYTSLIL